MNYTALQSELASDPLGRGYAGMTDQQAADSLNAADRTIIRSTLRGSEILSRIDPAEYTAIPSNQAHRHATVMGIVGVSEDIDVTPGSFARSAFIEIFGAGSNTIAALAAILDTTVSRAQELQLFSDPSRQVLASHVAAARSM